MTFGRTIPARVALALLVAGCNAVPPPPPVTSLEGRQCTAATAPSVPRVLPMGEDKAVTIDIDATFPCRLDPSGKPYIEVVFQLPDSKDPYLVDVASLPHGGNMFSPRLMLRDAVGQMTREFSPDVFQTRGPSLWAIIRVRPTDRFLAILSNAAPVGQQEQHITEGTHTEYVMAVNGGFFVAHSGFEGQETYTLAYNGRLQVLATPMPSANPGSSGSRPSP